MTAEIGVDANGNVTYGDFSASPVNGMDIDHTVLASGKNQTLTITPSVAVQSVITDLETVRDNDTATVSEMRSAIDGSPTFPRATGRFTK